MKKSDEDFVAENKDAYRKAHTAAALRLREDRRIMALPKLRDDVGELAALIALGSKTQSVTKDRLANIMHDPATFTVYTECLAAAVEAAKAAIA